MYRIPECLKYQSVPEHQNEQSVIVNSFRFYPRVPSEELNTKPDMEETRETGRNHLLTEFQIQIIRKSWS